MPLQAGFLDTSTMRIANKTDAPAYVAIYHQSASSLLRATQPLLLPADNAVRTALPSARLLHSRVLCIASSPALLPEQTSTTSHHFLTAPLRIGLWQADDVTLYTHTTTHLCATSEWHTHVAQQEAYKKHTSTFAYADLPATVQTELPSDDQQFLTERLDHVHQSQEEYFGETREKPLRIGICASGGGFRAMLATIGLLRGLQQLKLLSCVLTIAGLSGGTWAMLPWITSGQEPAAYTSQLVTRLKSGIMHHLSDQYKDLAAIKKDKQLCGLPVSGIDLYGIGIAHTLLKPLDIDYRTTTLTDMCNLLEPTRHPYPLSTAVTRHAPHTPYSWVTFSPFSICQQASNTYIPSWSLGRTFLAGASTNSTPPPLLGYCLGVFGSSFSISVRDALERAPEAIQRIAQAVLPTSWHEQLTQTQWANTKLTAAYLPNFNYQYEDAPNTTDEWLCLVDGGYLNNLPLQPLVASSEEPFDIIIVMDSKRESAHRQDGAQKAHAAAVATGARLAPLSTIAVQERSISLFQAGKDHDTTLVYLTLEPDPTFADETFNATTKTCYMTPNLFYNTTQATQLADFVTHVVTSNKAVFDAALMAHS